MTQLVLNWFQLYQKEKLRRKLDIVNLPTPAVLKRQLRKKFKKRRPRSPPRRMRTPPSTPPFESQSSIKEKAGHSPALPGPSSLTLNLPPGGGAPLSPSKSPILQKPLPVVGGQSLFVSNFPHSPSLSPPSLSPPLSPLTPPVSPSLSSSSSNPSVPPFDPLAALQKSRGRLETLDYLHSACVILLYAVLSGMLLNHLYLISDQGQVEVVEGGLFSIFSMVSMEIVLSLVGIVSLLIFSFVAFRILANLSKAMASNILKLVRHSQTTTLLLGVSTLYFTLVLVLCLLRLCLLSSSSWEDISSVTTCSQLDSLAIVQHLVLRLVEVVFIVFSIRSLKSASMSLRPLFPRNHKYITKKWLQTVLRENGTIPMHAKIASFKAKKLQGGCHYKCSRVKLFYSDRAEGYPDTVVIKLLYHDHPILERIRLYVHLMLGNYSIKEVQYLASYRIESHFYKHQYYNLKGLNIPEVYFNIEDCFNHKFGMVVQDLSKLEDGQPFGFNMLDTVLCVRQLAKWHATNWGKTPSKKEVLTWNLGGYWTGDKRLHAKLEVREGWLDTTANFPSLKLAKHYPDLGEKLFEILKWLPDKIEDIRKKHKTFIHGDFKISNLFLDNGRPRYGTLKPTTPSSLKDDKLVNASEGKFVNFSPLVSSSAASASDYDSQSAQSSPDPIHRRAGGLALPPDSFSLDPGAEGGSGTGGPGSEGGVGGRGGEGGDPPSEPSSFQKKKTRRLKRKEKKRQQNVIKSAISLESLLAAKNRQNELLDMMGQSSDYTEKVYTIDWQWFGYGNCAIDIAYFLNTSLHVDLLPIQDELLKLYYDTLVGSGKFSYSFAQFMYHYQLCHIDFCLYAIVCKWARMTPEDFNEFQMECKDGMHLRSLTHMHNIIRRAAQIVDEWGPDLSSPPPDPL